MEIPIFLYINNYFFSEDFIC